MQKLHAYLRENTLLKNSLYLMMSNGFLSLGGFIFWIFVARVYSTYDIGIATSLIGIISLLSSLALFGFNTAIMRFLPTSENKNVLINSTICFVTLSAFLLGLIVALNIGSFSPPLKFISHNPYYILFFIIFTIFSSLNFLIEAILTAFRSSIYVLMKNIVQAIVKLFLPFLLISLGSYGIFSSFYLGGIIAFFIGGILLYKKHNIIYRMHINHLEMKKIAALSIGTYTAGLMPLISLYVLPLLITNILGPEKTAFYYIVMTTTNVLNLIPAVIAQNLMVEGSYNIALIGKHLKKAMQISLAILVPCIVILLIFGNYVLLVFGKQYSSEGLILLRLLSLSSLLYGFISILSTLLITFNQIKLLIFSNTTYAILLFATSYYFIQLGIVGIGYATILSQILLILFYLFSLAKIKKLFLLKSMW